MRRENPEAEGRGAFILRASYRRGGAVTSYQLRAMSVGEILDAALSIYRDHFGTLVSIVIVCQGVPTVMNVYATLGGGVETHPVLAAAAALLSAIGGLIAAGATIWVISEAYLGGKTAVEDALGFAIGKVWRILIAGLAKYLVIGLAFIVSLIFAIFAVIGIAFVAQAAVPAIVYAVVFVVFWGVGVAPGLMLSAGYSVVTQAVVLEPLPGATDALGRSWQLTKGSKGRAILLGLVVYVLIFMPFVVWLGLALLLPSWGDTIHVGALIVSLMVYPVSGCAFTLFYYDLRVRKEAFDLEHLSQQLGVSPAALSA